MKYGKYDSQNHLLNNYHYRFGNKRITVRIPLPLFFRIEILSRETIGSTSALAIINACVIEYRKSKTTRMSSSVLLQRAITKLAPGTELFQGDEVDKLNHKDASKAIARILKDISGEVSTEHYDNITEEKQIKAFDQDSGEQFVRLKSLNEYLKQALIDENVVEADESLEYFGFD